MTFSRLRSFAAYATLFVLFMAAEAFAAEYPTRPIRFVVAFPPGGNADLIARTIGQQLSQNIGKPVVLDNRGGAGGVIGTDIAAKAVPDGYTILLVSLSHVANAVLLDKLPYDVEKDFEPVARVVSVPNLLVLYNGVPAKTVPELIALARAKPGELNFGAAHGTAPHISGELFRRMAQVDIVNVPYRSAALAVPDLESGRIQMIFSVVSTAIPLVKSGRIRGLAVTSAHRSAVLPEMPTISEFVPGYELTGWQGILAPARTPRPIVARLNAEIANVLGMPEVQKRLQSAGADPVPTSPDEFRAFIRTELAKMSKVLTKEARS
jgi:tripartite-type tricarboxylate transporter receptor subunit TctC